MLYGGVLLLEVLPVTTWLQTLAAFVSGDPGRAALPLWYLLTMLATAVAVGRVAARRGTATMLRVSAPLWALGVLVGWRISPAGFAAIPGGPLDLNWIGALLGGLIGGTSPLGALLGLLALSGYLWWRGLREGAGGLRADGVLSVFRGSLIAVIVAIAIGSGVRGSGRMALDGRLAVLLPLDVFAGLVAVALARAGERPGEEGAGTWVGAADDRPWLSLPVALAAVVVGLALLLGLVISYGSLLAVLHALGPVGDAINTVLGWLIDGYAYLVFLLFGWIPALIAHFRTRHPFNPPPPPFRPASCTSAHLAAHCQQAPPGVLVVVTGIVTVLALALVVALVYLLYRSLRALLGRTVTSDTSDWEERESLDGRALLGAQLRALLDRLRRARAGAREEALQAGSVRRAYRDLLRAAAAAGVGRLGSETPDEYAPRLGAAISTAGAGRASGPESADDVARVTQAYDQVRYGEVEPDPVQLQEVQQRAARLIARLRAR